MHEHGIKQTYNEISRKIKAYHKLTPEARSLMIKKQIPDLLNVCVDLINCFDGQNAPENALQFIPAMANLGDIKVNQLAKFIRGRSGKIQHRDKGKTQNESHHFTFPTWSFRRSRTSGLSLSPRAEQLV